MTIVALLLRLPQLLQAPPAAIAAVAIAAQVYMHLNFAAEMVPCYLLLSTLMEILSVR